MNTHNRYLNIVLTELKSSFFVQKRGKYLEETVIQELFSGLTNSNPKTSGETKTVITVTY